MEHVNADGDAGEALLHQADESAVHVGAEEFHALPGLQRELHEVFLQGREVGPGQDVNHEAAVGVSKVAVEPGNVPFFLFRVSSAGGTLELINAEGNRKACGNAEVDGVQDGADGAVGNAVILRNVPDGGGGLEAAAHVEVKGHGDMDGRVKPIRLLGEAAAAAPAPEALEGEGKQCGPSADGDVGVGLHVRGALTDKVGAAAVGTALVTGNIPL